MYETDVLVPISETKIVNTNFGIIRHTIYNGIARGDKSFRYMDGMYEGMYSRQIIHDSL
jgi:hypothetical protein